MKVVKVGIVSDTHGFLDPRILHTLAGSHMIIHAGDIMAGRVLRDLATVCTDVIAVAGNNELARRWISGDSDGLEQLPEQVRVELPGGILAVEHGHRHGFKAPDHQRLRAAHADARAVVYGHTHKQVVEQGSDPWILNPGAAGRERTHGGPACLILHAGEQAWRIETHRFELLAA